ncbi:MAG: 50S ribosomal protein L9 [Terrimicrobiaceae bacterium]
MAHTQILLTESVPNLGAEADIVRVRRGYARNFLIPTGKALELNPSSLRRVNHLKAKRAEREARELTAAEELAGKISKLKLSFELETGDSGKAFGSVTSKDIHDRIMQEMSDLDLPKHAVELEKAIKETGSHEVKVRVHTDVTAKLTIKVVAPLRESEAVASGSAQDQEDGAHKPVRKRKSA